MRICQAREDGCFYCFYPLMIYCFGPFMIYVWGIEQAPELDRAVLWWYVWCRNLDAVNNLKSWLKRGFIILKDWCLWCSVGSFKNIGQSLGIMKGKMCIAFEIYHYLSHYLYHVDWIQIGYINSLAILILFCSSQYDFYNQSVLYCETYKTLMPL